MAVITALAANAPKTRRGEKLAARAGSVCARLDTREQRETRKKSGVG